ncbi:hypothetical protein [Hyalangium rubrum]|uniref:Uncharacterized protein n=1 Tax=Hyalangium rubrum TaxID=3103134 RepID=A0ABU5H692_9BACT|nr:hypothetical protein [Hyalangium sp. s54d21]MDY7228609.1 hypothetical protein [Hyalangium sp. s54d21]
MENENRIASMSITPTLSRQTPKNEFGNVLARTAQEVVSTGAGLVGGVIPGVPVVSAAVSSVRAVVSSVASTSSSAVPVPGSGAGISGSVGGATGKGEAWDMLEAQKLMAAEGQKFNLAYLQLQNEMQQESREHNAVSNIMKVRHDSAKAAINNIR